MNNYSRPTAALVAAIALTALGTHLVVSYKLTGALGPAIWLMAIFFTILTNLMVFITFARMFATGHMQSAFWLVSLTLWILIVGIVYHVILTQFGTPVGLAWWADQALHTATPLATLLWWIAYAPKRPMPWRNSVLSLSWPLIYVIYALIRGAFTGIYPYPFIDLNALSYGQLFKNALVFFFGFWVGGLAIIAIARTFKES
jgi:hypothetical protein